MAKRWICCLLVWFLCVLPAAADVFTFAGYSFDQADTPDQGFGLQPGVYDGAIVTLLPNHATHPSNFPDPSAASFDPALTLGRLIVQPSEPLTTAQAANLPAGNHGNAERSGLQVSWSGGRTVVNGPGDDLVLFESSDDPVTPDGYMLQVRQLPGGGFTQWYFEPPDNWAPYLPPDPGHPTDGAFAIAIDLTDLGVGPFGVIDAIRLVNMTDEDRMLDASGIGFVLPEDNGVTSNFFPNLGQPYEAYLDPDPLYITVLSGVVDFDFPVVPEPSAALLLGLGGLLLASRRR